MVASFASLVLTLILVWKRSYAEEEAQCHDLYEFDASVNPTGDIYSLLYKEGKSYPNNLYCEYKIDVPPGYHLRLTMKDLDISPSDYCGQDTLIVFAKQREDELIRYCGTDIPKPYVVPSDVRTVWLLFYTDFMQTGRGFHLHYEASPDIKNCQEGLKECENRNCYNEETQKCDGVDDCGDGTDEEGCNLPLENSECGNPPIISKNIDSDYERIIGGHEVTPGSWPWQVSMQHKYGEYSHTCGGTLINAQWVITASHCFKSNPYTNNWRVNVGKHHKYKKGPFEQTRYLERIIVFPDVTAGPGERLKGRQSRQNDIALMKLSAPVKFNDAVRPACVPSLGWDLQAGTTCYATGWGETRGTGSDDALKQTDVDIQSINICTHNNKTQLCVKNKAGFQSTCHGDSGGPLSCMLGNRWYVMGAVSYGTKSNFISGLCAMPDQRTVFAKVSDKADWIKVMMEKYS